MAEELFGATVDELVKIDANNEESDDDGDDDKIDFNLVAPRSTQPFILLRLVKWVPEISGNLVVKSKLPPRSGSSFEAVEPHP